MNEYKIPLFLHGIGDILNQVLSLIKMGCKGNFVFFLEKFNVSSRMFYYYKNNEKAIPIKLFLKLLNEFEYITNKNSNEIIHKVFESFTGVSPRGNRPIILPKYYSTDLAYLTGFIIGDGHVSKRLEINVWEETKMHSNYLSRLFTKLFNYNPTKSKEGNYYRIFVTSAPIHFFFTKIIGLPEGKKKYKEKIPSFVMSNKQFIKYFLIGLFDSDGGVTISKRGKKSVLLSSTNEKFLLEIKQLLQKFKITFPGPYTSGNRKGFELRSFKREEIKKFNEKIGFLHPIKNKRSVAPIA